MCGSVQKAFRREITVRCSGRQGQLIIWAAAEALRLRRLADGADGVGSVSKATGPAKLGLDMRGTDGWVTPANAPA